MVSKKEHKSLSRQAAVLPERESWYFTALLDPGAIFSKLDFD